MIATILILAVLAAWLGYNFYKWIRRATCKKKGEAGCGCGCSGGCDGNCWHCTG